MHTTWIGLYEMGQKFGLKGFNYRPLRHDATYALKKLWFDLTCDHGQTLVDHGEEQYRHDKRPQVREGGSALPENAAEAAC